MSKIISRFIVAALMLFAATAWAQSTQQQIAQCRANNQRAHSEVVQLFNQARARGNISPNEARAFSDMERRLQSYAQMLNRGGLTLAECQNLSRQIAVERTNVQRMAASPDSQQIAQCRANNQRAHSEVMQMFYQARSRGNISTAEARAFSDMERRLNAHAQALNRGGLTLAECQQIGREIANERANVQRMAATPDPQVAQCRANNQRAHNEVMQMFRQARSRGNISPNEARAFADMERRLNLYAQTLNKGGLTLPECQILTRQIADERAAVQRMAASPDSQQIAQCRANNQRAHSEVMQLFNQARSRGNISPAEARAFSDMERRLNAHAQALNRGGLTLAECQQIGREIANERANVQRMAATGDGQQIAQCRANNQRAHNEVMQLFRQARSRGNISQAEARAFSDMERRLSLHAQALNKGGLTLAECQQIGRELTNERAAVQRMAAGR